MYQSTGTVCFCPFFPLDLRFCPHLSCAQRCFDPAFSVSLPGSLPGGSRQRCRGLFALGDVAFLSALPHPQCHSRACPPNGRRSHKASWGTNEDYSHFTDEDQRGSSVCSVTWEVAELDLNSDLSSSSAHSCSAPSPSSLLCSTCSAQPCGCRASEEAAGPRRVSRGPGQAWQVGRKACPHKSSGGPAPSPSAWHLLGLAVGDHTDNAHDQ